MISIPGRQAPGASAPVVASIHDDGLVLLHTGTGKLFAANRTGARIWQSLERRLPVDAIAAEISGEYQIGHQTAREHTVRFVSELHRHGLVPAGVDR